MQKVGWKRILALLAGLVFVSGGALTAAAQPAQKIPVQPAEPAPQIKPAPQPQPAPKPQPAEKVAADDCFGCHAEVQSLWRDSRHTGLECGTCHAGMQAHLQDSEKRPQTNLNPEQCGSCHQDQFQSSLRVNWQAEPRQEKGVPKGRSPLQDKLLAPHGFTVEHNEPRAHPFMVVDQLIVDRFAGGRYQLRDAWGVSRPGKTWEVLQDTGQTIPGLAKAGNAVCLQCKTSDLLLSWKYMGDPDPRAKWDRTSDVNALIKDVHNPVGCIHCHDPHGTRPRLVRDALIEAIGRDGANPYAPDKGEGTVQVIGFRDDFRKVALVRDARSNLVCGQCHVEYNCNPGSPPEGEGKVGMEDRRTNHFPLKNVFDILEHYTQLGFRDFRHAVTGARLIKLQHPEMETYWQSRHDRAGVTCADCHMLKEKNAQGEEFTSHAMVRPAHHVEESCLGCHPDSSPQELRYAIQAVQNYTRGKIRKAEYQLGVLIDTYAQAVRQGVPEEALAQARRQHEIAHVRWEWWTAENSDGWHNPEAARKSLLESQAASRKGVDILQEAMKAKVGAPVIR